MIIKNKIDNQDLINQIYEVCSNNAFPYYWNEYQINYDNKNMKQYGGFTHIFYKDNQPNSSLFDFINQLINHIAEKENIIIKSLFRVQANLVQNIIVSDEELENSIHQDQFEPKYKTILYYINDSDGDTIIYDENKNIIESGSPIAGHYLIYDAMLLHRATAPKIHKKRMVINCVFEV